MSDGRQYRDIRSTSSLSVSDAKTFEETVSLDQLDPRRHSIFRRAQPCYDGMERLLYGHALLDHDREFKVVRNPSIEIDNMRNLGRYGTSWRSRLDSRQAAAYGVSRHARDYIAAQCLPLSYWRTCCLHLGPRSGRPVTPGIT